MSKERFDKTVDVLVKAYLNDTLVHGNDCACAVGNMICAALGYKYGSWMANWHVAFVCQLGGQFKIDALKEVESTGYSVAEILEIERAFERAPGNHIDVDNWNFNGLMAVVTVLAEIDGISLEQAETARKLFVKS
jgi:hypothetical protein